MSETPGGAVRPLCVTLARTGPADAAEATVAARIFCSVGRG